MTGGKVNDMDEVTDAGAIRSIVVVAPDLQLLLSSNRHLRDKWQEVVRNANRVFSDEPAFMRANRIEVAQNADPPLGVGCVNVLQHLFEEEFCSTIWICRPEGMLLVEGKIARHAINRG